MKTNKTLRFAYTSNCYMLYVLTKVKILTHITRVKKNRSEKVVYIGLHIYSKYLFLEFPYIVEYGIILF